MNDLYQPALSSIKSAKNSLSYPSDGAGTDACPVAHRLSLKKMGIETERLINVGVFADGRRYFLEFHRSSVLLRASR